jgi:hypothetical protein
MTPPDFATEIDTGLRWIIRLALFCILAAFLAGWWFGGMFSALMVALVIAGIALIVERGVRE